MRGKFKSARNSIAVSMTLVVILIFVVGQGSLWLWFLFNQKTQYEEMLRDRARMASRIMASIAGEAISSRNEYSIKRYAERVASDPEILGVRVIGAEGKVLAAAASDMEEMKDNTNPFYVEWKQTITEPIVHGGRRVGRIEVTYSGRQVNEAMFRLLTIPSIAQAVVFAMVVAGIFMFIYRKIGRPLGDLTERIEKITAGDLTVEIPDMPGMELGAVADGVRFLVRRLSTTVGRFTRLTASVRHTISGLREHFDNSMQMVRKQSAATDQIALSVKNSLDSQRTISENTNRLTSFSGENVSALMEVKATEDEIERGMDSLTSAMEHSYAILSGMANDSRRANDNVQRVITSVENTSASVEEIIASVREVERGARESSLIAEGVREMAAMKGVATVDKAVTGMREITSRVSQSVEIVTRLGERSSDVQRILSVMKEVTERANLLSINASILAEQAGEYGKGFAVVAQEMRDLGDKTEGYTKDIAGIVKKIQREIREAIDSIENGMQLVNEGGTLVYEVGETMSAILEAAHESANMTKMIERATEDQVKALRHVESAIVEVNAMTFEMNEVMEKLSANSQGILGHIGEVREVVDLSQKGIIEQTKGVHAISKNIEQANEQVAGINEAISKQRMIEEGVFAEIEEIRTAGVWIISDMERVSNTLSRLREDLDALSRELESFKAG